MTYVASPTYSDNPFARQANLKQCLETARHRLNETSNASEAERLEILVSSALAAGWGEDETRAALNSDERPQAVLPQPNQIGLVPSSSL
ncbi:MULTISPECIES: hypothetical protein [unclassified Rhizobium]|uniref:hypothetical protein n=1 Tax=unclassified Rhizobium TaxID=2613769 RepID=UPI00161876FA|nr:MULTISPECIES: hypothetical protein [unclassified Rhizobium]MBB3319606.1 hypothetical protein [Rhizobium sp. BK181]MBB3544518.1 hypothetical protein [Rhizobium sp. BK399]MCS4095835.1 hypothetical protein [Rhizobium sp. BK176]